MVILLFVVKEIKIGYVAAIKAGQKGLKTICIEKRGSLGGTCLNVGCIPSKALLNAVHSYQHAKKMFPKLGIKCQNLGYDINQIQKQKTEAVVGLTKGIETLFRKNKVDYAKGLGTFIGKNDISVKLNDGGSEKIKAKNIIIATGSDVAPLPGEPFKIDEKVVLSSTGALSLMFVPKKMIVIGKILSKILLFRCWCYWTGIRQRLSRIRKRRDCCRVHG